MFYAPHKQILNRLNMSKCENTEGLLKPLFLKVEKLMNARFTAWFSLSSDLHLHPSLKAHVLYSEHLREMEENTMNNSDSGVSHASVLKSQYSWYNMTRTQLVFYSSLIMHLSNYCLTCDSVNKRNSCWTECVIGAAKPNVNDKPLIIKS